LNRAGLVRCSWQALGEGQRLGAPGAAELRRLLTSEEESQKYGGRKAKGKTITPADEVAGQGACRSLGNLGHSVDIAFDFDTEFSWHPVRVGVRTDEGACVAVRP
jgi:hypothetical protein